MSSADARRFPRFSTKSIRRSNDGEVPKLPESLQVMRIALLSRADVLVPEIEDTLDIGNGDDRHDSRKPAIPDNLEITLFSRSLARAFFRPPRLAHPRNSVGIFGAGTRETSARVREE